MQKNGMWIPLIASVGVGAATFYSMTKNNQGLGQTMEKMVPFVSQMGAGGNMSSGGMMNASGNMSGNTGNSGNNNNSKNNQDSQKLGTFGMS
ncbi:hypothetical protein F3157_19215 [Virgibacillus dakarensis]|uniref:Uncharacterized protein n=1 Tax=Lentibacillus populi TaxID=1827502 RepID=A0A9W5U2S4_9BACI|nr:MULTISPECIES: hypothetical protein [Bacillaceae]MBT2216636.1 hypothetical protein [Virgibacillus dakarensis]MTW87749.1 hypothetical protein [Virgibacillus dakarensis]GGB61276.1 hypothetical protein GCM10011409_43140 [Lentibacillus populi]